MSIDHSRSADPGGYPINARVSVPVSVARTSSGVHGHCLLGGAWEIAGRTLTLSLAMGLTCQRVNRLIEFDRAGILHEKKVTQHEV